MPEEMKINSRQPDDQAANEELAEGKDETSLILEGGQTSSIAIREPGVSEDRICEEVAPQQQLSSSREAAAKKEGGEVAPQPSPLSREAAAEEEREEQVSQAYRPLHKAALNGDWVSAERFFKDNPKLKDITQQVNRDGMTILHIAANMGHAVFMTKLVRSSYNFNKKALRQKDKSGITALHYAAGVGSLRCVKLLISQDNTLTQIPSTTGSVPLFSATSNDASRKVVWYLANKTDNVVHPPSTPPFSRFRGADLIFSLIALGHYDICLELFDRHPQLAADSVNYWQNNNLDQLLNLVNRPSEFLSGSKLNAWKRFIYHLIPTRTRLTSRSNNSDPPLESSILSTRIISNMAKVILWIARAARKYPLYMLPGSKHTRDEKYKHECIMELLNITCETMSSKWKMKDILSYFKKTDIHLKAAEKGATEIIQALFQHFPYFMDTALEEINLLIWAIKYRQEDVYNIMMERGITVKFLPQKVDAETLENALHTTAKLAPYTRLSSISCPALQMQRELQWFKGVEKFLRHYLRMGINKDRKTPRELFTTEHKDLVRDAETWLKDTARSCSVVATLILTVVFAAAFIILGGTISGTGSPLFLRTRRSDILVFATSDAIGMFSSVMSILMFLSILTARYAEDDFLNALPERLIFGSVSLLIALASIMVTFGATLHIVLHPRFNWIIYPIIGLTSIPVGLFVWLQLPLLIFMISSTYGSGVLKSKIMSVK